MDRFSRATRTAASLFVVWGASRPASSVSRCFRLLSDSAHQERDDTSSRSCRTLACTYGTVYTSPSTDQREGAWKFFAAATRQMHQAMRERRSGSRNEIVSGERATFEDKSDLSKAGLRDDDDVGDTALLAITPTIALQVSVTSSNAALMRELGVLECAIGQNASEGNSVRNGRPEPPPRTSKESDDNSLPWAAPLLLRVCQTGVQAQASSFVILRHIWSSADSGSPLSEKTDAATQGGTEAEGLGGPPTLAWAAQLPAAIRLELLSHEMQRLRRRRRYIIRGAQGEAAVDDSRAVEGVSAKEPLDLLCEQWAQVLQESRVVLLCCCAPWLLLRRQELSQTKKAATPCCDVDLMTQLLYEPLEREVLATAVQACSLSHAEDVAGDLMQIFLTSVDAILKEPADSAELSDGLEDFLTWYTEKGSVLYVHAMDAAAASRTHVTPFTSPFSTPTITNAENGFPNGYSYLVHRGASLSRIGAIRRHTAVGPTEIPSPLPQTTSWMSQLEQEPHLTMRLLRALADCVGANAEQLNVVVQLYLRLVEEAGAGYGSEEDLADTRRAFCAVLDALTRVSLENRSSVAFLEDLYRRTLLCSDMRVLQHADVTASSLRVCGTAGDASRAVSLFNKLSAPHSRALSAEERNVAAMLLSTRDVAATTQRLLSYLHTRLPVTADAVHAAASLALLSPSTSFVKDSTSFFALFDLLEWKVAAQHHVTRRSASLYAARSHFLRLLGLLAGIHEARTSSDAESSWASLSSPAAAAVFRQWCTAIRTHHSSKDSSGMEWPTVLTVGVLQEIALEMQRAARVGFSFESKTPISTLAFPLLKAVEEELERAEKRMPLAARVSDLAPLASGHLTLYDLPPSLQWRQLRDDWVEEERDRFCTAAENVLCVKNAASAQPVACLRYQDGAVWNWWRAVSHHADTRQDLAASWAVAVSRLPDAKKGASQPNQKHVGQSDDPIPPFCFLTPRAEVEWWLTQDPSSTTRVLAGDARLTSPPKPTSLCEVIGIAVPSALGSPKHTWASDMAAEDLEGSVEQQPRHKRCGAMSFWLQKWIEQVEDAQVRPCQGLFREEVGRMLRWNVQPFADVVSGVAHGKDKGESAAPSKPGRVATAADEAVSRRSGEPPGVVVEPFVQGLSSFAYDL